MKNRLFERVLFIVIGLLLILVCATGYYVYDHLHTVSESPFPSDFKENKRFLVRDLNNNILKSDNLTYSYLYQNNTNALLDFEILESQTLRKLDLLQRHREKEQNYQQKVSEIKGLITARFRNLDTLMSIQNENRVDETMRIIEREVQNASEITQLKMQIRDEVNALDASSEGTSSPTAQDEKKKLFKRKKKEEEKTENTNSTQSYNPRIKASDIAQQSSTEISRKINRVKTDAVSKEAMLNKYKLNLEQENNRLSTEIAQLFQSIEMIEKNELLEETKQAKKVAAETNQIILLFSVISSLLIVMIVLLIISLFRKSKQTNQQLKEAKEKSDLLTEAKSRFLATMSHEIRTPLNAISGFTEQLFFEPLSDGAAKKVKIIRSSVKHLSQITNEILDLSKLEKEHLQLEQITFNPVEEILAIQEQYELALAERNNKLVLKFDSKPFPNVIGDSLRFRQILINLLSNSNKFSENSNITIHMLFDEIDEKNIRCKIQVQDQGIGISEQEQQRIFEPFEQADSATSRKYGGTGLGLSIIKRIIEKFNGTISLVSKQGFGTTFFIEIPFLISEEQLIRTNKPTKMDFSFLTKKSILIVDDEPFNRILLKSMFQEVEMTIYEATNGLEALEHLKNNDVDLVLLDVRMPEMNGHEMLEKMIELESLKSIPVVGLTATLDDQKHQEMLKAGWAEVLTKPVNPEDLRAVLFKIMKTKAMTRELDEADFNSLQKLTNDNMEFFNELLQTFISSTENGMTKMNAMNEASNWNQLAELAHQLAAPFKHFGAVNCYATLKEIERLGKENPEETTMKELVIIFNEQALHLLQQVKEKLN